MIMNGVPALPGRSFQLTLASGATLLVLTKRAPSNEVQYSMLVPLVLFKKVGSASKFVGVVTKKSYGLVAVLVVPVTVILPVVAPAGTVVVMEVPPLFTVAAAVKPLNFTTGEAPNDVPVMVTVLPIGAPMGETVPMAVGKFNGLTTANTTSSTSSRMAEFGAKPGFFLPPFDGPVGLL
jgi:hypothetical protein